MEKLHGWGRNEWCGCVFLRWRLCIAYITNASCDTQRKLEKSYVGQVNVLES